MLNSWRNRDKHAIFFVAKYQMEKSRERSSCNHYLLIRVMVAMIRWKCITEFNEKTLYVQYNEERLTGLVTLSVGIAF
jgi:hypothetical protein